MSIPECHDLECMILDETVEPKALPFSLLADITDGFSEKLEIGRGGFATVYKGILEKGDVAVKRLSNTYMHEKEFHREVECLMKVNHRNIVRFLGYCSDTQGNVGNYEGKFVMADRQERLLCFEYLPNGTLHDYIQDASCGLEWRIRYRIIKDICEGLLYLHQNRILHLDLKPANILLDRNMVAKITDFGISRCFQEDQTKMVATEVGGTLGYLAPEFPSHVVTQKFDFYSLGVIILEILTGKKGYQDIQNVLEIWSNRLGISQDNPVLEQIKVCAEIGLECTEFNPTKRPDSMKHIIDMLVDTECAEVTPASGPMEFLGVHPLELFLPFEYMKLTPCPLYLTNNTNKFVAFRLFMDESKQHSSNFFVWLPVYGLVPPRTTYTLLLTTTAEKEQLAERNDLILESTVLASGDERTIKSFRSNPAKFLVEVKDGGTDAVQEVRLKAVRTPPPAPIEIITSSESVSPQIKMIKADYKFQRITTSLDTIDSKQWIIEGHDDGLVRIWNHETQKLVSSFKVSAEKVTCVKFVQRMQWFVVGTEHGFIYVYNCEAKMQKITSFMSISDVVIKLAVHPTQPLLLSSHCETMRLWDWDNGWTSPKIFASEHQSCIRQVIFNSKDTIASASDDHRVKVWNLKSSDSMYTFSGHSDKVNCLYFFTCYDREYLVTGSHDQTAKIWDMQKMECVRTLEASMSPVVAVLYEPKLQILITCSEDGCVYLWCTTNSRINSRSPRLERIINTGFGGAVHGLSYMMGRVVIGKEHAVAIMDIDNNVNNLKQPTDDYTGTLPNLNNYTMRPPTDTPSKVTSSIQLLDIAVEVIDFPCEPNEYTSWSVHLKNKTDEHVAFMIVDPRSEPLANLPQYGIVTSRSSYILIVSATKEELARGVVFHLNLRSSTLWDKYVVLFDTKNECAEFFEDAKDMGNDVHEETVLLKPDYHRQQSEDTKIKIISIKNTDEGLCSLDAHPTEQWIITGHTNGYMHTWNYKTQGPMDMVKVSGLSVTCVKLIARKQWMVAVTSDNSIYVYNCACVTKMQKMTSFRDNCTFTTSLAVHPIHPFVLSTSGHHWYWDKGWMLKKTRFYGRARQVVFNFNLKDTNTFAVTSKNEVKVWSSLDSYDSYNYLSGHLKDTNSLDFFTHDDVQFLITGSDDCTAKIWDLRTYECIHTMEAIMSPVACVLSLPDRPYLVTGSKHGTVQLWSSTDFRLERTVNLGSGGPILGLVSSMSSQRVVVGQKHAISTLQIEPEEAVHPEEVVSEEEEVVSNEATKAMSNPKCLPGCSRRKVNCLIM